MRKIINICAIVAILFGLYLAFTYKEPRNGFLVVGEKQAIQHIKNEHQNEIKSVDVYSVKITKSNDKSVFIMKQKTAENVIKKGVLRETDNDRGIATSNPIRSLPTMINGEGVVLSNNQNENLKKLVIGDHEIRVSYGSNTWFGHERNADFEDMILIVDDATFNQISVDEIYMGIIELNKVYGNNHGIVDMNNGKSVQIEKEFTKLTKGTTGQFRFLKGLSIINQ
ncbi:lipoprotein BA_5634 family protein [uncultured Brevibacillus sp.]|uniref:lipoprotein BA_5634 family protein n=1 Tax=uncultured Brevibacillus sp. TaxID=169970 RepID=UPI002598287D|nr:lipoprotein BA_5634 family protein [uncultured Brevibacillus sp.]